MKLRPLDDRIVIKQSEAKEKTDGGIFLPDTAKEKPQIGKVIATGPGKLLDNGKRSQMSVKKNDEVILYGKVICWESLKSKIIVHCSWFIVNEHRTMN